MTFKDYITEKRFSLADFATIVITLGIVSIITGAITTLLTLVFD